jgi:chemotaxis protein methyltransferase CheR
LLLKSAEAQTVTVDLFEKASFERLKKMVKESLGINCDGYREEYLRRRFDLRLKETKTFTFANYVNYLRKTPSEFSFLLRDLTVNYTSFFRDIDVYKYLEKTVLPSLLSQPYAKIWSAGCSTGEEPYTLAILVSKLNKAAGSQCKATIFASDIDKEALAQAKEGSFRSSQLQGVERWMLTNYFVKNGDAYIANDQLKSLIRFEIHDLMKPYIHQPLDLILCRNVMIYFSREGQQVVHMNFFNALRNGGYFVSGKTEMLSGEPAAKFKLQDLQSKTYRKPEK